MNHYQHHPYCVAGKTLVNKVPAHVRYAGFFNGLLGLALLATLAALGYTTVLLKQFMETSRHPTNPPVANFCPFPFNPANPGCKKVAEVSVPETPEAGIEAEVVAETSVPAAVTGAPNALGWVYVGKNNIQQALKTEGEVQTGNVYTMRQNLNVRRLPVSSTSRENRKVLRTVFAGEKVRVLALASNGAHRWLQVAQP